MSIRSIFVGPLGVRAGWRALLFMAVFAIVVTPLLFGLGWASRGLPTDPRLATMECGVLASALAATLALSRFEGRRFSSFGLGGPGRLRNFAVGLAAGFGLLSLLIGLLAMAGVIRLGPLASRGASVALWAAFWALVFVMVGFAEEMVSRGYLLYALSRGIGFWPAAIATSLLFGAAHVTNAGESAIGVTCAALIGLVNAYSLRWSGSLWWAIGLHASWDWGETFFYGVSNSGQAVEHRLLSSSPLGPGWLSGGPVGPEGSALVFPVIVLLFASVRLTLARASTPDLDRPGPPTAPVAAGAS